MGRQTHQTDFLSPPKHSLSHFLSSPRFCSGKLTQLRELNVNYNKLSSVPPELGDCESLERLELTGNLSLRELPFEVRGMRTGWFSTSTCSYRPGFSSSTVQLRRPPKQHTPADVVVKKTKKGIYCYFYVFSDIHRCHVFLPSIVPLSHCPVHCPLSSVPSL